jgi:hypothetical protein
MRFADPYFLALIGPVPLLLLAKRGSSAKSRRDLLGSGLLAAYRQSWRVRLLAADRRSRSCAGPVDPRWRASG